MFVDGKADLPGTRLVDAEVVQGLTHVEIGLAGGDDAEAALAVAEHHAVELVGASEGEGGVALVAVQALLLRQRRVRPADVQSFTRPLAVLGQHDLSARGREGDARGGFPPYAAGVEARRGAAESGQSPTV